MKTIKLELQVPNWASYITINRFNEVCIFEKEPLIDETGDWNTEAGRADELCSVHSPSYTKNWKKSKKKL